MLTFGNIRLKTFDFILQLNFSQLTAHSGQWNMTINTVHLFSVIYKKAWPGSGDNNEATVTPDVILKHTLSWPLSFKFFNLACELFFIYAVSCVLTDCL